MIRFIADNPHAQLWKSLEARKVLTKDQFRHAVRQARDDRRHITEVLLGSADSTVIEALAAALAEHHGVPFVTLRRRVISPLTLNLIPREVAEEHGVVAFKKSKGVVHLATIAPENLQTIDFVRRKTGLEPQVFLTTPDDIRYALQRYQGDLTKDFARIIEDGTRETLAANLPPEKLAQFVPTVTMVNAILERALRSHASDIHLEPSAAKLAVRYRIDGLLTKVVELPAALLAPIATRIKLLANMKIDEHRLPQDGRFSIPFHEREIAVRASVVPTLYGPTVALRLLDTSTQRFTLKGLGLNPLHLKELRAELTKPHGMVLATGPTGSGKTTTLYALLRILNRPSVNICTIEDPIEYGIEGISQTQVNPNAGLTFANGLRSLLRQDPNIIMVGEVRDADTASVAVNAAMTGHLVLSSLHTNTAALTVQRLVEMGVEPFLAASVINVVIGQRLVRRICRSCTSQVRTADRLFEQYEVPLRLRATVGKLVRLGLLPAGFAIGQAALARGRGCERCSRTGFLGRVGIYEVLRIDERVHAAILADPTARSVEAATGPDYLTMAEDGILKVIHGETTFDEVLRVMR